MILAHLGAKKVHTFCEGALPAEGNNDGNNGQVVWKETESQRWEEVEDGWAVSQWQPGLQSRGDCFAEVGIFKMKPQSSPKLSQVVLVQNVLKMKPYVACLLLIDWPRPAAWLRGSAW